MSKRRLPQLKPGTIVELKDRARSLMNEGTFPPRGEVVDFTLYQTKAYGSEPGRLVRWIDGRGERSGVTVERLVNLKRSWA